jgi:hypothetical protein
MIKAAYIFAALALMTAGLMLWIAYGPVVFLSYMAWSFIC